MSKQTFDDFMTKLQQDADLQRELKGRFGKPEEGIPAAELEAFAADKGYRFDVSDVSTELSDEQLGAVAGGLLQPSLASPYSLGGNLYIKIDGLAFKF